MTASQFVIADHQHFYAGGKVFQFVGVNSYDLGVVGNNNPSTQLSRLQELQTTYGVNVVRTWAFGETNNASAQNGYLQYGASGGQWNETAFVVLDNAVAAAKQLGMRLILCLCNNWTDYGGKAMYVTYYNNANSTAYNTTIGDHFHDVAGIQTLYKAFINKLLTRTNTVTGVTYANEPTIFSWECINEGRYTQDNGADGSDSNQNTLQSSRLATMTTWYSSISTYIKSLDSNHLVGTGSIGQYYDFISGDPLHNGTYYGLDYQTQHALSTIDYYDMHWYPWNAFNTQPSDCTLKWASANAFNAAMQASITQAHAPAWGTTLKPVIWGEVGIDKRNNNTSPVVAYPRSTAFQNFFTQFFGWGGDGFVIWNADNDQYQDNNFGLAYNNVVTDSNVVTYAPQNVTDDALLTTISNENVSLTAADALLPVLTATDVQNECDTIAKHVLTQLALINSATTLTSGQSSTLQRIADLDNATKLTELLSAANTAVAAENTWLTSVQSYTSMLACWQAYCAALDTAVGGLATFLAANYVLVDPHFRDAFNNILGSRTALSLYQAFGSVVSNLGQCNVTSAGNSIFQAGSASPYGNAPLSLVVQTGATGGTNAGTYTVTYNQYTAAGSLTTGLTASGTIATNSPAGTTVALGVQGCAVTNITVSGGNAGDRVAVASSLLRSVGF